MAGTCLCAGEKAHGKVPTRLKSVISWHRAAVQCVPGLSAPHVPGWPMEEELMMVLSTASWQLCRKIWMYTSKMCIHTCPVLQMK